MKTRYYYLIFPLLLCLSQMLHAQDKPVKPIEPNEKLNAGASVTKQLVYHDAGENTANYYRFSTMEPLLFSFSFSDFSYSRGWGDPLPQTVIVLNCNLTGNESGTLSYLFRLAVEGKTGEFLISSGGEPMELPAGDYQFTFAGHSTGGGLHSLQSKAATSFSSVISPPTYFFDLHITTEVPPAPVVPDPEPDDEVLPDIPSPNRSPLVDLPTTSGMNSVCSFVSRDGGWTNGYLTVNYADDLGRSIETARNGYTAQGSNLVSLQEYDSWGRKGNIWLEAAKDTLAGAYLSPAQCKTLAARTNGSDSRPYTETVYEESPLNRPIRQYGPGQDWKSKGKALNSVYTSNSNFAGELHCMKFAAGEKTTVGMTVTATGYYDGGSLQVVKTTDEDGKIQLEFTARNGSKVLSRQIELKGSVQVYYDTYYLYDGAGNLRAVLPPELSAKTSATGSLTKAELDKYAYLYAYDSFRRLSDRKLPGADWECFIYDDNDRLVASQDGNLRKAGKWKFMISDKFNRVCLEGVCTSYFFLINLQLPGRNALCEYVGKKGEHYGYAVNGISLDSPVFCKIGYYDNYRFLDDGLLPLDVAKDSLVYALRAGYGEKYVSAKGSLTGVLVAQMGASGVISGELMGGTFYYDARGRLIQSHSGNHLDGFESEYTAYNFCGQPVKLLHVHSVPGKASLSEQYTYTYNEAGLPLTARHRLGNGVEITLSDKEYDAFGRLHQEKRNGNSFLKSAYIYNVRSWLTGIVGQGFSQNMYYNVDGLNGTKFYNGNISSMTWKLGNEGTLRHYIFLYDPLNRLQDAVYSEGSSGFGNLNGFTEQVTGYDKNGNILGLKRYGQTGASAYGLIDNLTVTLNGNQLASVNDAVMASAYNNGFEFKDGAKSTMEYAYDLNGNLTKDLNKNIISIQYNMLNLPSIVSFSDGSTITYTYSVDGTKLRIVHKIDSAITTTDYLGNVVYENGVAKLLLTGYGYVSLNDKKYHYYLQDHQGNNRVVVDSSGKVEETNHYYPFGGTFASTGNVQPYKYNGKELDAKKGLNWYDYGARMYDAALGRWHVVDPMAEKYCGMSPYAYCNNSPTINVDLDGKDWYMHSETGELYFSKNRDQWQFKLNDRIYYRIGDNDMLGDMKDVTERAYNYDESLSLAQDNGYSINPIQEILSEVSREQPYSTGKKSITVTTGEIEIINEKYGIFPVEKSEKKNFKTDPLYKPKYDVVDYLDAIATGAKKVNLIERNYFTYNKPTLGDKTGSVLGTVYGVMETMTGKHDYRNVRVYKNWNSYLKTTGGKGRMLLYRK